MAPITAAMNATEAAILQALGNAATLADSNLHAALSALDYDSDYDPPGVNVTSHRQRVRAITEAMSADAGRSLRERIAYEESLLRQLSEQDATSLGPESTWTSGKTHVCHSLSLLSLSLCLLFPKEVS